MHKVLRDEATEDCITITKQMDGGRNTILVISGHIKNEDDSTYSVIDLSNLAGCPTSMRLDNCAFLLESGLKCMLTYKDMPYFIPLEGRGKVELDAFGGIAGHEIDMTLKGTGMFFVILDISKLGV